jgi:hypothetical protein
MNIRFVILATALAFAAVSALFLDLPPEAVRFLLWTITVAYLCGIVAWTIAFFFDRTDAWDYEDFDR